MKIRINRTGHPDYLLWNSGWQVRLWGKILGFYIFIFTKHEN
jgi:hypothetical protein